MDIIALNRLSSAYLQRLSETSDLQFLQLAQRAAKSSLAAVPAEVNPAGLASQARASLAAHEFVAARGAGEQLLQLAPEKSYPHEILGDALFELGEYERARNEYAQMEELSPDSVNTQTRLGQQAWLHGQTEDAVAHLQAGLERAQKLGPGAAHSAAWCHVQLGDIALAAGQYVQAEQHFQKAGELDSRYHLAWGGMGKARAAQGDLAGAIAHYTHALNIQPDLAHFADLGDLYELTGQKEKAREQATLIEILDATAKSYGLAPDRRLIANWANHRLDPQRTFDAARKNYADRHGVRDADVLAWAALQAGKLDDAQAAAEQALRLNTPDPLFFYHAGLIAAARGDKVKAIAHLQRALALSPRFDPIQAPRAKAALDQLISEAKPGSLTK